MNMTINVLTLTSFITVASALRYILVLDLSNDYSDFLSSDSPCM